jgi:hypothetical protein
MRERDVRESDVKLRQAARRWLLAFTTIASLALTLGAGHRWFLLI